MPKSLISLTLLPDKASPHILSLGKKDFSKSRVLSPAFLANIAADAPAGPAPTIIISYMCFKPLLHQNQHQKRGKQFQI